MASGGGAGGHGSGVCRRQKRMGPAPFASFEDLSDEATDSSPNGENATPRLPGINEDVTPSREACSTSLTPSAPRIDISRASSSSQHEDSRDSTPERELFQTGPGQGCARLGLAFREEGALELRSSTEELDFQDPTDVRRGSPVASVTVVTASSVGDVPLQHQRKDSQGSEYGGLLSISGRTSRLSSIGSQGSRVSGASRLSVTSGMSRSPSPHKMLLETSFCGSKSETAQASGSASTASTTKLETELLERVLLSRKHDPTEAVLAEGISIECRRKIQPANSLVQLSPVLQHQAMQQSAETPLTPAAPPVPVQPASIPPEKPVRKSLPPKVTSDVIITVDKPAEDKLPSNDIRKSSLLPGKTILSDSGVEYTFIPLKGPLPKEADASKTNKPIVNKKSSSHVKSTSAPSSKSNSTKVNNSMPSSRTTAHVSSSEPQYIRIKLKPDHMYTTDDLAADSHTKPATLDLSNGNAPPSIERSPIQNNSTPSPSISRKSSFASLFRGKEYGTSPESPTVPATRRKSSRSRSKSSDRDRSMERTLEKPTKHRSVFTLFKSKKSHSKSKQSLTTEVSPCRQTATSLHSLEFTFDRPPPAPVKKYYEVPLEGDSIIIPLHSPGSEPPPPLPLYASDENLERRPQLHESASHSGGAAAVNHRQSSTSSENVVFTTNLGSDNEIFTTKLPKRNECTLEKNIEGTSPQVQVPSLPLSLSLPVANGGETVVVAPAVESTLLTHTVESTVITHTFESTSDNRRTIASTIVDTHLIESTVTSSPFIQTEKAKLKENVKVSAEAELAESASERVTIEGNDSSESENENLIKTAQKSAPAEADEDEFSSEHERKGLVLQQDSFEDELPYVPTTLPLERSVAIPIIPIKQRAAREIRTCPIERPRSTTPINPSCLEDYCEDVVATTANAEKLRISLPKDDSIPGPGLTGAGKSSLRGKSPRRWTEFVPQQQQSPHALQSQVQEMPAPPLPPRGAPRDWINFEEIPERRKPPKRIQTIPSRGTLQSPATSAAPNIEDTNVIYSYVNPEDCKCECHETGARATNSKPAAAASTSSTDRDRPEEDEQPLLLASDRRSDSSPESHSGAAPPPPAKKSAARSAKSTNAFPHVATTSS